MSNEKLKQEIGAQREPNALEKFKFVLEKNKAQLINALPKHINADRMIRLACTEFSKNPKLLECDSRSVFGALIQASQLGLEIGVLGQAYLVPYFNGKTKKLECQCIPGYKGLISLARRSGEVTSIETNIVYTNDKFEMILGIESSLKHEPFLDGHRGDPRLVYGVAKFKDGGYHLEWMPIPDVDKIKSKSISKLKDSMVPYSPWVTDYEQMVRKTLIRRMANYLPMSVELQTSLQVLDKIDAGEKPFIEGGIVITEDKTIEEEIPDPAPEEISSNQEEK
jgi:recombination protein RecT